MPRYRFAGSFETTLLGLANGVNATVERRNGDGEIVDTGQPEGSTVVVLPGDVVTTDEPYENAHLVDLDPAPEPEPVTPAADTPEPAPAESPQSAVDASGGLAGATTPEDSY